MQLLHAVQNYGVALLFLCSVISAEETSVIADNDNCRDLYPLHCSRWRKFGFCNSEQYRPIMHNKCKMTCGYCDVPELCVDLTSHCSVWMKGGLCEGAGLESVRKLCKKSCQLCDFKNCPRLKVRNGYFDLMDDKKISELPNTGINGVTLPGTRVNITCKPGFHVMGDDSVICRSNGQYDKPLGVCLRRDECQVPTYDITYEGLDRYFLVSKVMDDKGMVSPGTFAILVCKNGRKQQSFCSGFGSWIPPLKDCDDDTARWSRWSSLTNNSKRQSNGTYFEKLMRS